MKTKTNKKLTKRERETDRQTDRQRAVVALNVRASTKGLTMRPLAGIRDYFNNNNREFIELFHRASQRFTTKKNMQREK